MQMPNTEALQEKWAPVLDYEGMDPIKDSHRRAVTAVLLENQEQTLREERDFLSEAPTNAVGNGGYTSSGGQTVAGFDPVLISLIRRAMPNLVAYDLAGVTNEWSYWTHLRIAFEVHRSVRNRSIVQRSRYRIRRSVR